MRPPFAVPLLAGLLTLTVLPLQSPAQAQSVRVACTLAEKLDTDTFSLLGNYDPSEVGQDSAASDLAQCWAAGLTRDLAAMPRLSARMVALRRLYRQLRSDEGELAYAMMGGGTLYIHAVPRSFPGTEQTLRTLAALASSPLGGQVGQRYARSVRLSQQAFAARVAALKSWKPSEVPDFDRQGFLRVLADYQKTGNAVMSALGSRGDAATAAGYLPLSQPLFLDEILADDSLGSR